MNLDAKSTKPLFRLPVRRIENPLLRGAAIILSYPFMVAITLLVSAVNSVLLLLFYAVAILVNVPRIFWVQQRNLYRTIGPAWRREPLP